MELQTCDVAIVGSGFGGTLTALILRHLGIRPLLVERGRHPRFALGESSTPLADLVLEQLARQYDLPELLPLCQYGSWKRSFPELNVGLKRGFSYFYHEPQQPFQITPDHRNEMLVAASYGNEDSDTHWHRADFDHHFARLAIARGIPLLESASLSSLEPVSPTGDKPGWILRGEHLGEPLTILTRFVIDASGAGAFLPRQLGLKSSLDELQTHSRCLFSHFTNVRSWEEILRESGHNTADHTFPCDAAALHHLFHGGWMFVLRFDDGTTSAGFSLDPRIHPQPEDLSPEQEWNLWLDRFPSLRAQFQQALPVAPEPGKIQRTSRLQRFYPQAAGPDWALLPTTAGIIDALHSSGNAHTLFGVQRLARTFAHWHDPPRFAQSLQKYSSTTAEEIRLIDELVGGCYRHLDDFSRMSLYSMCYFVAAHSLEARRMQHPDDDSGFLRVDEPEFRSRLRQVGQLVDSSPLPYPRLHDEIAAILAPDNSAGFLDLDKRNMYPYRA